MKFTPESLIEIYMNGSFTEEAQAEFDALMRKDPQFAQSVTSALAERVGAVPQELEGKVSSRLDAKVEDLWLRHKPSPYKRWARKSLTAAILLASLGGLYEGYHRLGPQSPSTGRDGSSLSSGNSDSGKRALSQSATRAHSSQLETSGLKNGNPVPEAFNKRGSAMNAGLPSTVGSNLSTPPAGKTEENIPASVSVSREHGSSSGTVPNEAPSPLKTSPQTEEGDALRVSIETEKSQNVIVTVLDSNGFLVRHLYQGVWKAGVHLVDWDGKDEVGNQVLPGNYTVVVKADGQTLSGQVTVQPNR